MFILGKDKEELKLLLEDIKRELCKLKLRVNEKKTHIVKLSHGFTYMQIKYSIDGKKIIKRPCRKKVTRERRRLKKHRNLLDKGVVDKIYIYNCYMSWRNSVNADHNACKRTINTLDSLFNKLFGSIKKKKKLTREDILREAFENNSEYTNMLLTF